MTPDQYLRVRAIFEEAIDREPAAAAAWVALEAADDDTVKREVLSLLEHHSHAGEFLSEGVAARVPGLLDEDDVLAPGALVGTYTIVRELGRGGMGRVYLATDSRLGRAVALKALAPQMTRDPMQRERLRREARAAAALTHPGICTVYALEEVDGDLFIASEYVEGHTLREEIAAGKRPSPLDLLQTARELAASLASAHAKGITHRDLKPENVMRTGEGRLKILDFGLARMETQAGPQIGPVTQPGMLIGTPAYMAPEQLNGEPADARADVFSLGVLLYEYACGVHPFEAGTALALLARVLESDARPIGSRCPGLAPSVAAAIDRCLQKVPSQRFESAVELSNALDALPAVPSIAERSRAWWRTHQLSIIALYVVASATAWRIKEYFQAFPVRGYEGHVALWAFVAIGVGAGVAGIVRGHLVFTDWMNASRLNVERGRTDRVTLVVDLVMAVFLLGAALLLAPREPLMGVLTSALALGIALARVLMEPATTAAAFE